MGDYDFHARSRFARPTIPEEKWGTTCSLNCQDPTYCSLRTADVFPVVPPKNNTTGNTSAVRRLHVLRSFIWIVTACACGPDE